MPRPALRPTQPPIKWELGTASLGIKQQMCETDYPPPTSAEVEYGKATFTPTLMVWYLTTSEDNFTFTLI
jgi:hypothetical protein